MPLRVLTHHGGKQGPVEKVLQPEFEFGVRGGVEPFPIRIGKLADEGTDRSISNRSVGTEKKIGLSQPFIQSIEKLFRPGSMNERINILVAVGLLIAVQIPLEVIVIRINQFEHFIQCAIGGRQPAFRVMAPKSPKHDVQTLVDDLAVWEHKNGNGRLGRKGQK